MKKRLIALILTLALSISLYAPEYRSVPIFPGEIIYHIRPDELYRMLFIYKIKHPVIIVKYKGNNCYIVDAELVSAGKKTNRVFFNGKIYFCPVQHAEEAKEYGKNKCYWRGLF